MSLITIVLIAFSLAMDAFAVSLSHGIQAKRNILSQAVVFGIYFGVFQFIMPILGYLASTSLNRYIAAYDHWIAFGLLLFIGGGMLYDTFRTDEEPAASLEAPTIKNMLVLAVATSIDAMAVGISLAFFETSILTDATIIGIITFILSATGFIMGSYLSRVNLIEKNAGRIGGVILIIIGARILIEHLFEETLL